MSEAEQLLMSLAERGGQIVSSDKCSALEIAIARAEDRFAVVAEPGRSWGFGFVRRPAA